MIRFAPLLFLAAFAAPAAAHDAPLALAEAIEAHLLDCPSGNGYLADGKMLSLGWKVLDKPDKVLASRAASVLEQGDGGQRRVNFYSKEISGFVVSQMMTLITDKAKTEVNLHCTTVIRDLPYMPSGKFLGAVFGKDVEVSIANSPGDYRDGYWLWDNVGPTHNRTIARYTNSFSDSEQLPEDVYYPGFYIRSFYTYTADQESEQP